MGGATPHHCGKPDHRQLSIIIFRRATMHVESSTVTRLDQIRAISGCPEVHPVPGFEGYFVTGNYQVWSYKTKQRRIDYDRPPHQLKRFQETRGQMGINLCIDGQSYRIRLPALLDHARHGVDPRLNKLATLQRLMQREQEAAALIRRAMHPTVEYSDTLSSVLQDMRRWLGQLGDQS
jgi:hypothetical protein